MENIRIPRIMKETSKRHLHNGKTIGFVPTMGALHEGHLSLVKRAKSENDIVVVSIFVNPIQFGRNEDFDKYPRDMDGDMQKLIKEGVDILFIPDANAIYPENFATHVIVDGISDRLCGAFRPGHFAGVATVVCKLFNIVMPTRAYFGQKDYQQTLVIKRMTEDLNMDVDLIICPTFREPDGLAMSSRNAYLIEKERESAPVIYKTLLSASQLLKSGASSPEDVKKHMHDALKAEPLISEIQYAGVYDTNTLDELKEFKKQNLLAVAVKIGSTRLIDNMIAEF
jgi:pantoate--beta-alanine ligase